MLTSIEKYFDFAGLNTTWRTEVFAGLTTFVTRAYIIVVNPAVLGKAGLPIPAVTAATCISAAFGSIPASCAMADSARRRLPLRHHLSAAYGDALGGVLFMAALLA